MPDPFDPEAWYKPDRDGDLDEYLQTHDGHSATAVFKGYHWYKVLKKQGYLIPNFSVIRLMWNVGGGDEHFIVTEDFKLKGLELKGTIASLFSGRKGIHDPKSILSKRNPCWETQDLQLDADQRKQG